MIFLLIIVKARKIRFADEDEEEDENENDEEEESQNEDKVCKTFIIKYIPILQIFHNLISFYREKILNLWTPLKM